MGKDKPSGSDKSENVSENPEVVINSEPETSSNFVCHAEFVEGGKTIHYLYNSTEKDPTKAWKKSKECSK